MEPERAFLGECIGAGEVEDAMGPEIERGGFGGQGDGGVVESLGVSELEIGEEDAPGDGVDDEVVSDEEDAVRSVRAEVEVKDAEERAA